jgi:hypothetical protein
MPPGSPKRELVLVRRSQFPAVADDDLDLDGIFHDSGEAFAIALGSYR